MFARKLQTNQNMRPFHLDLYERKPSSEGQALRIWWRKMPKCGICGAELKEQPKITAEGKCSACGAKLTVKK